MITHTKNINTVTVMKSQIATDSKNLYIFNKELKSTLKWRAPTH